MPWACAAERWENNQGCCVTPSRPSCVTTVVQRPFRAKMVRFKQLNLSTGLKAWGERSRREPWQSECGVLRATCRSDSTRRAVCDGRRRTDVMLCDRKSYGNVCNHRLWISPFEYVSPSETVQIARKTNCLLIYIYPQSEVPRSNWVLLLLFLGGILCT